MKKVILGAILLFSILSSSQTVSLTSNTTYGSNCGQNNTENITINGDLNLNGYTLNLRNVNLTVTGNLNGGGQVDFCGNRNNPSSSLCVNGVIQNNPNLNNLTCRTLNIQEYDFTQNIDGLKYIIYDIQGRVLLQGLTDKNTFNKLESNKILFIKIEGYRLLKIYKN